MRQVSACETRMKIDFNITQTLLAILMLASFGVGASFVSAQSVDELKGQITDYNTKIAELEAEIAKYEAQLSEIGGEKQTLQKAVDELRVSRKKLLTNIQITQNRIYSTTLQIEELGGEIVDKHSRIENGAEAVARSLRHINELESQSMIEAVLGHDTLNEFWDDLETIQQFQTRIAAEVRELIRLKTELETTKKASERKKAELTNYNTELSGQRVVLEGTLSETSVKFKRTAQKESEYQALLNEKIEAREKFESELRDIESQLRVIIDPSSIPPIGAGVLRWPFSESYMSKCPSYEGYLGNIYCITQYFGNTPFASKNPQVYNGGGHSGVDFRASTGTKVQAALAGTVVETGDTDLQRGCYSYGKWVLIKHNNGLSTLYAHLSHISVRAGKGVGTGEVIGFSGNTGYSTGPHLHFSVFASQGVQVVRLGDVKKITNCSDARIPVAPHDAYLNPLSYL
ncbi:MAG: peptidoglycan DD-metalloendopeptidase family protein [Candidatus Pacebacteria bacterium]|nr:peptidoglycan DD-metalloendopeptidase family protein [Candidatus Paceibacterota bacterium]